MGDGVVKVLKIENFAALHAHQKRAVLRRCLPLRSCNSASPVVSACCIEGVIKRSSFLKEFIT